MKRRQVKFVGLLMVAGLALCIGAVATQRLAEGEREVSIAEVPDAVRATILAQAQGGAIDEIELGTENGQAVYEADVVIDGRKAEIRVAADGTLLGAEADDEDSDDGDGEEADEDDENEDEVQVAPADVPEAVRATIAREAGGAEIKEIEKETEDGQTIYSADVVIGGQEVELAIAPDGTLLGREVEDEDDED